MAARTSPRLPRLPPPRRPRAAAETEASARVEAEAAATGSETGLEAGAERAVAAGAVLTEVFTELAAGLSPVLVQGAALLWAEAEPEAEAAWLWCEWVVHGEGPFSDRKHLMRFR